MKALITGASSGMGREFARILSKMGYDLILVARRKKRLESLAKELKTDVKIIDMDISSTYNCMDLYNRVKKDDIDIVINNAGFGLFGKFDETKLDTELDMIDLNIKTVHTLTKLFLKDFKKKNKGYILNVASAASFLPGPLMDTYYATKSYVFNLTLGIYEELKQDNSNVYVGCLCPGPVNTEFNKVAKASLAIKSLESNDVVKYAIKKMFKKKIVIIPSVKMKIGVGFSKLMPIKLKTKVSYYIQSAKAQWKTIIFL